MYFPYTCRPHGSGYVVEFMQLQGQNADGYGKTYLKAVSNAKKRLLEFFVRCSEEGTLVPAPLFLGSGPSCMPVQEVVWLKVLVINHMIDCNISYLDLLKKEAFSGLGWKKEDIKFFLRPDNARYGATVNMVINALGLRRVISLSPS